MFSKSTLVALAAASLAQAASPQGFNYGNMMGSTPRTQQDFHDDFVAAQALSGAPGTFNSARLYTMLDGADGKSLIPALAAAQATSTYLLLGLWASVNQDDFMKEINALKDAVSTYPNFANYILGISVGSEDLYRISPTGLSSPGAAAGQEPDTLVQYINQTRQAIAGSSWSNIKVGHVDTWTAWVNGSNAEVIANSDFLGVDAYPYWQNTQANAVSNGKSLFDEAFHNTQGVASGKEVWLTETGWAVSGPVEGQAQPGISEAKQYWDEVGCAYFGNQPTFWYTLYDGIANSSGSSSTPSFSITQGPSANYAPWFDLSCSNVTTNNNSANSTSTSSSSGSSTATGSSSTSTGSGASNGTYTGSPSQPSGTTSSGSGSSGSSSGSGSGSSSGSSGSSGSGSASASAAGHSGTGIATSGAASLSFSLGSMAALVAAVVALL